MNFWIGSGSFVMFLTIAFGAFGAHALKNVLTDPMKVVYETAVRYQGLHGLALFVVAWLSSRSSSSLIVAAGWSFLIGIVIFCGSLYVLCITEVKTWGAATPIGGVAFLAGWSLLGIWALRA